MAALYGPESTAVLSANVPSTQTTLGIDQRAGKRQLVVYLIAVRARS